MSNTKDLTFEILGIIPCCMMKPDLFLEKKKGTLVSKLNQEKS